MKAYPPDVRLHILQAIDEGTPLQGVVEQFDISLPSIRRWLRQRREQGHVEPKPSGGGRPGDKYLMLLAHLPAQIQKYPHATGRELCKIWNASFEEKVSPWTMARALKWLRQGRAMMNQLPGHDPTESTQPIHQVAVDGQIIYEGDDWAQPFLEASKNPTYGTIVHMEDGKPGATFGPVLHQFRQTPL